MTKCITTKCKYCETFIQGTFFECSDRSKMTEAECQGHYIVYIDGDINKPEVSGQSD